MGEECTIGLRSSMAASSGYVLDAQREVVVGHTSSADTARKHMQCSYRTIVKGLQENRCTQERSTGSKEKNHTICVKKKKAMRRTYLSWTMSRKSVQERSEEKLEVEQIWQSKGLNLEDAVKEKRALWKLKF